MNVVIYARVSSTEQLSGYSIEAQIGPLVQSALERFYQGDPPEEVFRDAINSGFLAALYEMDALGEVFGG